MASYFDNLCGCTAKRENAWTGTSMEVQASFSMKIGLMSLRFFAIVICGTNRLESGNDR